MNSPLRPPPEIPEVASQWSQPHSSPEQPHHVDEDIEEAVQSHLQQQEEQGDEEEEQQHSPHHHLPAAHKVIDMTTVERNDEIDEKEHEKKQQEEKIEEEEEEEETKHKASSIASASSPPPHRDIMADLRDEYPSPIYDMNPFGEEVEEEMPHSSLSTSRRQQQQSATSASSKDPLPSPPSFSAYSLIPNSASGRGRKMSIAMRKYVIDPSEQRQEAADAGSPNSAGSYSGSSGSGSGSSSSGSCSDSDCSRCACRIISPPNGRTRSSSAPPQSRRSSAYLSASPIYKERPIPRVRSTHVITSHASMDMSESSASGMAAGRLARKAPRPLRQVLNSITRPPRYSSSSSQQPQQLQVERVCQLKPRETNISARVRGVKARKQRNMFAPRSPTPKSQKQPNRLSLQRISHSVSSPSSLHVEGGVGGVTESGESGRIVVDEDATLEEEAKVDLQWRTDWLEQTMERGEMRSRPRQRIQPQEQKQFILPRQSTSQPQLLLQAQQQIEPSCYPYPQQQQFPLPQQLQTPQYIPPSPLHQPQLPPRAMMYPPTSTLPPPFPFTPGSSRIKPLPKYPPDVGFATAASLLAHAPPIPVYDLTDVYGAETAAAMFHARYPQQQRHHFLTTQGRTLHTPTQMRLQQQQQEQFIPQPAAAASSSAFYRASNVNLRPPSAPMSIRERAMVTQQQPGGGVLIQLADSDDEEDDEGHQ